MQKEQKSLGKKVDQSINNLKKSVEIKSTTNNAIDDILKSIVPTTSEQSNIQIFPPVSSGKKESSFF